MLVLQATDRTQGHRSTDYHWCLEGELVYLPFQECSDRSCGCSRGFAGLESRKATTTACVAERRDLTRGGLAECVARSLFDDGWITSPDPDEELVYELVREITELARGYAEKFGVGVVIEREGDFVQIRPELRHVLHALDR